MLHHPACARFITPSLMQFEVWMATLLLLFLKPKKAFRSKKKARVNLQYNKTKVQTFCSAGSIRHDSCFYAAVVVRPVYLKKHVLGRVQCPLLCYALHKDELTKDSFKGGQGILKKGQVFQIFFKKVTVGQNCHLTPKNNH